MFSSSRERAIRICLTAIAASSLLALAGIVIFLFTEGLPLFRHVSPLDFLLGDLWYPTEDPGLFGIFPLLVGSVAVTVLSSLLAVPLGVMTAVYLAEIAPPFARRVIKPFVELLAALPSVVLGFLGMVVLAPILQDVLGAATGLNLLNASLVLAIMSLPTICSVSEDALRAVPRSLREASLALGDLWYPTEDPGLFGIFPLLVGSVAVTVLSSLLAVPLGVMTAVYLAEIAPPFARRVIKPFVELLAALPSVVLGFLGMVVLAPILQDVLGAATGLNLLNASLVLAIMSLPTICSVSEDALRAVPRSLREASLALGATRWETIVRVVVPAALSGIGTAIMLGMSRAMGETMVVLMAAGGAAMLPQSLLDPVRPMPASIAAEMAEAPFRSDHYYALFATGIVLFLMTLAFNMIASRIAEKHRQVGSASL